MPGALHLEYKLPLSRWSAINFAKPKIIACMGSWGLPRAVQGPGDTELPAVLVLLSHKRTPVNDEKIRNTDICFNWFQYDYNIGFLLFPPLTRPDSLKDGGICTPKLSQINKNLQLLNRADNIRPYRANKDIAKNSKHSQALNRVEQSPTPTERTNNTSKRLYTHKH